MPGIVGIISKRAPAECERLVSAMVTSLRHQPFYESGIHSIPELGVYAGWTAHPDSFAQRESSGDRRDEVVVVMAGECLVDDGWPRIAAEYRRLGEDFTTSLNGLFSGVVVDRRAGEVVLFNDRYGIERLFVYESPDAFYFASEAKAILLAAPETRSFDADGLSDFLSYGFALEGRSLFKGIRVLPAGSRWRHYNGTWNRGSYFSAAKWEAADPVTSDAFDEALASTLTRILPMYFRSEQPVGLALTGGLDTRMIVACGRPTTQRPISYTYAGLSGKTLDAVLASRIAAACGFEHETLRLAPEFLSDFATHADRTVFVTDGSFGIAGAHELYLSARARQLSGVRLTGVFGGEVLRGVSTFKPLALPGDLALPDLRRPVRVPPSHPVTAAAFTEMPVSLAGSLAACRSQLTFRTPFLDNRIVELAYRAPAAARSSVGPAVRLIQKNAPALAAIPTDRGHLSERSSLNESLQRILATVSFKCDYIANDGLPASLSRFDGVFDRLHAVGILGQHKYLRYRRWFRRELADYVQSGLAAAGQSTVWNRRRLEQLAHEHHVGHHNHLEAINAVLTLEAVERLLLRSSAYSRFAADAASHAVSTPDDGRVIA